VDDRAKRKEVAERYCSAGTREVKDVMAYVAVEHEVTFDLRTVNDADVVGDAATYGDGKAGLGTGQRFISSMW
jgi:hypothetical protein